MSDDSKAKKVFGHLTSEVHVDLCSNCGACIASCPVDSLKLQEGRPSLTGRCTACALCYAQCPQVVSDEEIRKDLFGEKSEPGIGYYREAVKARSKEFVGGTSGGGFVTALLKSLLGEGYIDGAVLMDKDSQWNPEPRVVTTKEGIEECSGSKYTPGPILTAAREAVERYALEDMAVVGTPCQVKALREMSRGDFAVRKITDNVKLVIGLFCRFSLSHDGLIDGILEERLGLEPSEVERFDFGEDEFAVHTEDGQEHVFSLESLEEYSFTPCSLCSDFTAEFGDISVGGAGSPEDWSSVLVRTEKGERAYGIANEASAFESEPMDSDDLNRIEGISEKKMRSAEESIKSYSDKGKPLPPRIKDND